jgi:preprotein translocase subunit SecD
MRQKAIWMACLLVMLLASAMQAQAQFSIRAASPTPVDGWERMQVEHCRSQCVIWVAPTAAITASDIENAQPNTSKAGDARIAVVFTDAGAKHFANLTTAQLHKQIAMVLDGKVIWAPIVMAEFHPDVGKEGMLAGSGPQGLTQQEVERILALVK